VGVVPALQFVRAAAVLQARRVAFEATACWVFAKSEVRLGAHVVGVTDVAD
jgi:hypothetical protein